MPSTLARKLYPVADLVFGAYGRLRARRYDLSETIIVSSSGRGGSTWLAEIVATLPGRILLWEPLHLNNNPECVRHGFTWQNYIRKDTGAPQKQQYLKRLLRGEALSTRTLTSLHFKPLRFLSPKGYVVKFVNANMMLYWLLQRFPVRAVLMVRHPCAVVSSQLVYGAWEGVTKETCTIPEFLFDDYPQFRDVFDRIQEPEEVLAFEWAVQTHVPLSQPLPHPWLVTTYERLVEHGREEVERIFEYLGEPVPSAAYDSLRTASATTVSDSNVAAGKNPLTGWKSRLTTVQIDNILRVVREMGVDYYSGDLLPDYERLPGYDEVQPIATSDPVVDSA